MDVGAAYDGYAADVTRTFPVNGRFTPEQRAIYQLVRDAQAAAERQIRPGVRAEAVSDSARELIARGLARLGLIESAAADYDPPGAARGQCERRPESCRQVGFFYLHGLGHGIGLEVHDPAQYYLEGERYQAGDAFTIEPGVYVNADRLDLLPDTPRNRAFRQRVRDTVRRYHGIGVRIEDDYLLTESGLEWISRAPREVDEIEAIGASGTRSPGRPARCCS
jgi:Xaa-Pro aminopeptidase